MYVQTVTPKNVTAAVWAATTRKLTGFGNALLPVGLAASTLAAGLSIDIRPGLSGTSRSITIGIASAGTGAVTLYDGSAEIQMLGINGTSGVAVVPYTTTTLGGRVRNTDGAASLTYFWTYQDLIA